MNADRGVLYVARGQDYADLACQSAASLRAFEPDLPIDLMTDAARVDFPFDKVTPLPEGGRRGKILGMRRTRFERTLFLDCDTLVLNPLGDLFDLLARFDLALAHDVRRATALVRSGHRIQTPYAFPQLNTGVLLYRSTPKVMAFLDDWAAAYRLAAKTRDQLTFRDLIWQSDLRFHVLPPEFNLRRVTVLDAAEPGDFIPTILHSHQLLRHLRGLGGRVTTLAEVMALERRALADDWPAKGFAHPMPEDEDPLARFRATDEGAPSA